MSKSTRNGRPVRSEQRRHASPQDGATVVNFPPQVYTLLAWGSSENFQFSSANPPFWRVRARSSSWGTTQKGHEDQAARTAGGDPGDAAGAPRRNHHQGRIAEEAVAGRHVCGLRAG